LGEYTILLKNNRCPPGPLTKTEKGKIPEEKKKGPGECRSPGLLSRDQVRSLVLSEVPILQGLPLKVLTRGKLPPKKGGVGEGDHQTIQKKKAVLLEKQTHKKKEQQKRERARG